jgi:hypothetical protein
MSQTKVQAGGIDSNAVVSANISDSSVTPAKLSTGAPTWNTTGTLTTAGATVVPQDSYIKLGDAYVSSGNITSGSQANSRFAHFSSNIYYNGSNWVSDGRGPGGMYQMFTTPAGVVSHNWYKHNGTTGTGTEFTSLMSLGNDGILRTPYGVQIGTDVNPGGILNINNAGTIYSFRGSIIDAVNANNTAWADFNVRGANVYLRTPDGAPRLGVTSDGKARTFNGGGSMADGVIITSSTGSIGRLNWIFNPGYVEALVPGSAIGWNVFFSDEKLKQNISPSVFNSSELINKIKFIKFDWKPETQKTGHVDVGLSAQNLQSIDERLVNVLSDDTLMVNEPVLIAHITKALQEALSEIEALKTRISALESE